MKAYRNVGGVVTTIKVDVDLKGNPILPPDTTTDNKPSVPAGHYATVVGNRWAVIKHSEEVITLEKLKGAKLSSLEAYRTWLIEQPIEYVERSFDADETARARVSQALVTYQALDTLPEGWIDADNLAFPITTYEDLKGLALAIAGAFQERFFTTAALRQQIMEVADEAALDLIEVPSVETNM